MRVADDIRRGAIVLKYVSFVVIATAVVGEYLQRFDEQSTAEDGGVMFSVKTEWSEFARFLQGLTYPVALAGIVLAFSFVLKNSAARLNLDIVLAREQAGLPESP